MTPYSWVYIFQRFGVSFFNFRRRSDLKLEAVCASQNVGSRLLEYTVSSPETPSQSLNETFTCHGLKFAGQLSWPYCNLRRLYTLHLYGWDYDKMRFQSLFLIRQPWTRIRRDGWCIATVRAFLEHEGFDCPADLRVDVAALVMDIDFLNSVCHSFAC